MSGSGLHNEDRMLQLLADRATEGLEGADAAELDEWLATNPGVDAEAFERTAAVVTLTRTSVYEGPLPMSLRGTLLGDAAGFFGRSDET